MRSGRLSFAVRRTSLWLISTMTEEHGQDGFPIGYEFLDELERAADTSSRTADEFSRSSGEKLPVSLQGFGTLMSLLYRAACCFWGCRGGNHQIEWLTGRVVNEAMSSYRLIRAAYYDESLMLTRGIGEIANLFWLFNTNDDEVEAWRSATRQERIRRFGPAGVRRRLEELNELVPIDRERYQRLCEVGTHPTPGFAPGHYSGSGRPVLGVLLQPVGVYVGVTELCYATAMSALGCARLLDLTDERKKQIMQEAFDLIHSLGAFNVLNYEELLQQMLDRNLGSDL